MKQKKYLFAQGYSLVEFIITICLLLIAGQFALASYKGFLNLQYKVKLDCAVNMVAADIRLIQQKNLNSGNGHSYKILFFTDYPQRYIIVDRLTAIRQVTFDQSGFSDVLIQGAPPEIKFNSDGVPVSGYTLILKSKGHIPVYSRQITVLPATGRVMVK